MDYYTKRMINGFVDKACKVASAAVLATSIFGAGMYTGAALYHKYRNPSRIIVPDDVPNGDLNKDGLYPDLVVYSDGRIIPMYKLEFSRDVKLYGGAGEARTWNWRENQLSKEDYASIEKKLNDDFERNYGNTDFLGFIIRDWLYNSE